MCANFLSNNEVFLNAAGAAAGGFVGVILFFGIRLYIESVRNKPKVIKIYQCANDMNRGQHAEVEGELKHHHGRRVESKDELAKLATNNPVWEWTRDRSGDNPLQPGQTGASVFYGPYTTDLTDPGLYEITFRIRGMGFTKPAEITNNINLLKLDVNCILAEIVGVSQGVANVNKHENAAQHFVRVSDLAKDGWQEIKLKVWSGGRGIWEYRAWAFDGAGLSPNNFEKLDRNVRIFFDSVTIKKINKLTLPHV